MIKGDKFAWIQTYIGMQFWPFSPEYRKIDINDIAHSLANQNRYTGHTRYPYSVAQHSIYVSRILPAPLRVFGLLHDAAETYVHDIVSPMKKYVILRDSERHVATFSQVEDQVLSAIAMRFGLPFPFPMAKEIHAADMAVTTREMHHFFPERPAEWKCEHVKPAPVRIGEWGWKKAKKQFLAEWEILMGDYHN